MSRLLPDGGDLRLVDGVDRREIIGVVLPEQHRDDATDPDRSRPDRSRPRPITVWTDHRVGRTQVSISNHGSKP